MTGSAVPYPQIQKLALKRPEQGGQEGGGLYMSLRILEGRARSRRRLLWVVAYAVNAGEPEQMAGLEGPREVAVPLQYACLC